MPTGRARARPGPALSVGGAAVRRQGWRVVPWVFLTLCGPTPSVAWWRRPWDSPRAPLAQGGPGGPAAAGPASAGGGPGAAVGRAGGPGGRIKNRDGGEADRRCTKTGRAVRVRQRQTHHHSHFPFLLGPLLSTRGSERDRFALPGWVIRPSFARKKRATWESVGDKRVNSTGKSTRPVPGHRIGFVTRIWLDTNELMTETSVSAPPRHWPVCHTVLLAHRHPRGPTQHHIFF